MNESNRQLRSIKVHPRMVFDIIHKQAGTVEKAAAELITNSADAGATRCDVEIDTNGFKVSDDGKGFASKQEIEDFFETFGTPHKEGDAYFGRHRIGRGQIMAFARTHWRSGAFEMEVDVPKLGADYHLTEHPTARAKGCVISGAFYQPLFNAAEVTRNLAALVALVEIPVFINGARANQERAHIKWDHEDSHAFYKWKESGGVSLYNLGMFVENCSYREFGVHGLVVTKASLTLNWARTDVIRHQCKVWPEIEQVLRERGNKNIRERKTLTKEDKEALWRQITTGKRPVGYLNDHPLFELANGTFRTARQILDCWTLAKHGDPVADQVIQQGLASVLSPWTIEQAGGFDDFEALVSGFSAYIDFQDAAKGISVECRLLKQNTLSPDQKVALQAIRRGNVSLHTAIRQQWRKSASAKVRAADVAALKQELREDGEAVDPSFGMPDNLIGLGRRQIRPGSSNKAVEAWTNGRSFIALDMDLAVRELKRGPEGATRLMLLLLHEYCHDDNSDGSHIHGPQFHETFHDLSLSCGASIGVAAAEMAKKFAERFVEDRRPLSERYVRALNTHAWLLAQRHKTFPHGYGTYRWCTGATDLVAECMERQPLTLSRRDDLGAWSSDWCNSMYVSAWNKFNNGLMQLQPRQAYPLDEWAQAARARHKGAKDVRINVPLSRAVLTRAAKDAFKRTMFDVPRSVTGASITQDGIAFAYPQPRYKGHSRVTWSRSSFMAWLLFEHLKDKIPAHSFVRFGQPRGVGEGLEVPVVYNPKRPLSGPPAHPNDWTPCLLWGTLSISRNGDSAAS